MGIKNSTIVNDDFVAPISSSRVVPTHKRDAMVGFGDDLLAIKERLCGESFKLQVIPIVGMRGIGKTTLARNAFEDPLIVEKFHIRIWVTVSLYHSVERIILSLIDSLKELDVERSRQDNKDKVHKSLKSMKYLIVMDDMWNTEVWDDLQMIFPNDHNGSRIMLTTRLETVVVYPNRSSIFHKLRFMDEDQSWILLRQKVFEHQDYCPAELEEIGKEIARSCGGLPLAIVVIAGILSTTSKAPTSWGKIAKNVNSAVATKDGEFERIISLSYTHLPHHLRLCFLYMAGYPEDCEINVSKLVKLWVAEGFLERPSGSKTYEEVAEECLEDLVKRSLVSVTKRKTNGKMRSCGAHDLVRDLCIRKTQDEKFFFVMKRHLDDDLSGEGMKNGSRVSITHSDPNFLTKHCGSTIRTILCFLWHLRGYSLGSLGTFMLLRVLDLLQRHKFKIIRGSSRKHFFLLPAQLFELFHLRYLAFDNLMNYNPAAISNLQNLETLITRASMTTLPQEIWKMPQLRHIISFSIDSFPCPQQPTLALKNLQTLYVARSFVCTKEILKMVPNLRKLGISFIEGQHLHLENLIHLHQLESFRLKSYDSCRFKQKLNHAFPRTLKKLTLENCVFAWEDISFFGSLPNLEVLKLRKEYRSISVTGTWRTTEGEFLVLKHLLIQRADPQHWITESSHFPTLKCLILDYCRNLKEIPQGIGEIPTLEQLEVRHSSSLADSARRIQEEQRDYGNDALQVRCLGC